jgi:L-alanine-DL-glutamate epimerase-like enolase superfamily enzyme
MRSLRVEHQSWPLAGTFAISRGSRTTSEVVVAKISDGEHVGHAECMPYARYDETVESVIAEIEGLAGAVAEGLDRQALQESLSAGAARNALDCALWDLEAKRKGMPVWLLAGLEAPGPLVTAYTLSLDSPVNMAKAAALNAHRPLMKLKLTGEGDIARVSAVRKAAPNTRLIVDANEGWSLEMVEPFGAELAPLGVEMIEQPIPAAQDSVLAECAHPVPICADESCHTSADLDALDGRYEMINIKLDKTGGLTEALTLRDAARARGMTIMVGCMIGTSLAMAPAVLVAQGAEIVDLDGPLLLAKDRPHGLVYEGSVMNPPDAALWG